MTSPSYPHCHVHHPDGSGTRHCIPCAQLPAGFINISTSRVNPLSANHLEPRSSCALPMFISGRSTCAVGLSTRHPRTRYADCGIRLAVRRDDENATRMRTGRGAGCGANDGLGGTTPIEDGL